MSENAPQFCPMHPDGCPPLSFLMERLPCCNHVHAVHTYEPQPDGATCLIRGCGCKVVAKRYPSKEVR